jgi:transcriptional regulator with XRE-family HTH domain
MVIAHSEPVGNLLREWRTRRRLSQLDLACDAEISTRHLSFVETGRSQPSREMILHLADRLDIPLRDRNVLLVRAGYAPVFQERPFAAPELDAARKAIDLVLRGHQPYPAIAVDRHWTLVASNNAIGPLLAGADPLLLAPPVNVLRLSLHPAGLAPRITNFSEWRSNLLARLRRQIDATADEVLRELFTELHNYPVPAGADSEPACGEGEFGNVVLPFKLMTEYGLLSLFGTTTVFGTPVEVTLSELALEMFFPADALTQETLIRIWKISQSDHAAAG